MPTAARSKKSKKTDVAEVAEVSAPVSAPAETTEAENTIVSAPQAEKGKKKGGSSKKPVKVVAVVTPDGIEGSFQAEPRRPLIAHLQIRTSEVQFHDEPLRYDPNPPKLVDPEPYDASATDYFLGGQETLLGTVAFEAKAETKEEEVPAKEKVPCAPAAAAQPAAAAAAPCFKKWDLMAQYRNGAESKKLPESTEIACFWCAHTFQGMPCVIPEREVNGVYTVYGNFCSPECGVSYLLGESLDPHTRWERMALLHRVYDPLGNGRIFPAPARETLSLFGGPFSIETFRKTASEKRVRVDVHMPPMVSILGSIDTKPIDFFDTTVKSGISGPIVAPARSIEEGLRLKRSKPLKEKESTLDSVMNITIGGLGGRR